MSSLIYIEPVSLIYWEDVNDTNGLRSLIKSVYKLEYFHDTELHDDPLYIPIEVYDINKQQLTDSDKLEIAECFEGQTLHFNENLKMILNDLCDREYIQAGKYIVIFEKD